MTLFKKEKPDEYFIEFDWSDKAGSIKNVRVMLLKRANEEQTWYRDARWLHGVWSKLLKFSSILLVGFGTLCPLINNLIHKPDISWGYLSLSLGGIIMLFDRHLSLSSGFQRFYIAEMEIIRLTDAFVIEWETEAAKTKTILQDEGLANLMKIAKNFDADISKVITNETKNWSIEFAQHLDELQKTIKNRSHPGD